MSDEIDVSKVLTNCIVNSIESFDFKWDKFFRNWFRENGTPLFFLFKKNLSVTNTQYVELFSLLTQYSSIKNDSRSPQKLLFYTTEHIKTTFSDVINSIIEDYNPNDISLINHFSKQYLDVFRSTVAIDMFYGSCSVFLPHGIYVDLEKIVSDSGYIHSAGTSVYIRNIKKSKKNDFLSSIDYYLSTNNSQRIPFIVYSHEDFSGFDKDSAELIERGIEQCKIFIDKMSMGSYRLSSIISEMQTVDKYNRKLLIPQPGNYSKQHSFKGSKSLWLISDRSISGGQLKNPGQSRYYICYEQSLKNDSPFFYFDENKPAWKSHTTLPHSLTAALLNTSRQSLNDGNICDPFSGTGTTWFEAKRLNLPNKVHSSDLSPATSILVSDNLNFFLLSLNRLELLYRELKFCFPETSIPGQFKFSFSNDKHVILDPYTQAKELLEYLRLEQSNEDQEYSFSSESVKRLYDLPYLSRLVFYVALRAELRFQGSFKRKAMTYEKAYEKSLNKLLDQIAMLIELRQEINTNSNVNNFQKDTYIKTVATYSVRLIPSFIMKDIKNLNIALEEDIISSFDARNLKKSSNDLIICDPPYGFNTNEDTFELGDLYVEFIDKAIDSLKPFGQLIMCLPAESYTGKDLPYCTRSDLVSRSILIKAHLKGRKVFKPANSIPMLSLNPPYYWESERALRRVILHFHFY